MNIYIAAPWVRRADAAEAKRRVQDAGHRVTAHWIDGHFDETPSVDNLGDQASQDWQDVEDSDVLILLNLEMSAGKATELGIALVNGLRILLVGPRQGNVFHNLSEVEQFDTLTEALDALRE